MNDFKAERFRQKWRKRRSFAPHGYNFAPEYCLSQEDFEFCRVVPYENQDFDIEAMSPRYPSTDIRLIAFDRATGKQVKFG